MNLDEELKLALRRTEPPAGFAERVLARAKTATQPGEKPPVNSWKALFSPFGTPIVRWAAGAALLCLIVGLIVGMSALRGERRREAAQAEAAKAQLMLALAVASDKMNIARRKVSEIGIPPKEIQPRSEPDQNRPLERRKQRTSRVDPTGGDLLAELKASRDKLEIIQWRVRGESGSNAVFLDNE